MSSRSKHKKFEIASNVNEIHKVEKELELFCKQNGMAKNQIVNCAIAVTEVVNNAIRHGNKEKTKKKVFIEFIVSGNRIKINITDQGSGFDPESLEDPLHPDNVLKESGRGIFIARQLMDDIHYKFSSKGTTISLSKLIKNQ